MAHERKPSCLITTITTSLSKELSAAEDDGREQETIWPGGERGVDQGPGARFRTAKGANLVILLRFAMAIAIEELIEAVALGAADALGQQVGRKLWKVLKKLRAPSSRKRRRSKISRRTRQ